MAWSAAFWYSARAAAWSCVTPVPVSTQVAQLVLRLRIAELDGARKGRHRSGRITRDVLASRWILPSCVSAEASPASPACPSATRQGTGRILQNLSLG